MTPIQPNDSPTTLAARASAAGTARAAARGAARARLMAQRGMTLIEIMVVIAIIGILSTAIGFGVVNYMQKAKVDACKAQLRTVANGVDLFAAENDFPSDLRDVVESKLVKEKQLVDPWKQDFIYNYPATKGQDNAYDLCSKGPDKVEGNDDDICHD